MSRRKRLCMISTEAENEHQHDEAQGQSNAHTTNETNCANSDNPNELGVCVFSTFESC